MFHYFRAHRALIGASRLHEACSLNGGEQGEDNGRKAQLVVIVSKAPPEETNALEQLGGLQRFGRARGSNSSESRFTRWGVFPQWLTVPGSGPSLS